MGRVTKEVIGADDLAAQLAAYGLEAIPVEELAALHARAHELRAVYDGLHGHGMVFTHTATEAGVVWSLETVAPRQPLDAPDLPPPYRALRLVVYAAIARLRLVALSEAAEMEAEP